jgi:type IV secretion system protein VirD4
VSEACDRAGVHTNTAAINQEDPPVIAFDPTRLLTTPADAVRTGGALLHMSRTGLDSGSIWTTLAEGPLAAMLYAASACGNGKGIGWVLLAVDNVCKDHNSPDAPGWYSAARDIAQQPLFRNALLRTLDMHPRQRDSIVMTMCDALSPWIRPRKESTGE